MTMCKCDVVFLSFLWHCAGQHQPTNKPQKRVTQMICWRAGYRVQVPRFGSYKKYRIQVTPLWRTNNNNKLLLIHQQILNPLIFDVIVLYATAALMMSMTTAIEELIGKMLFRRKL